MSENAVPEVNVGEAHERADAGALVLDVREPDEWHAGHVDGALWIPLGEIAARQDEVPHDRQLVVVCRSGHRSGRAVAALVQAGYDAVNLAGGMRAWQTHGFPLVADGGEPGVVT